MASIHLIQNDPKLPQIKPVEPGSDVFQSGYWAISEATATRLKEGNIFFHGKKVEPSFFGGKILDIKPVTEGQYQGRIIFIFKSDRACKGIKTSRDGWAQEMKIIP